MTDRQTSVRDTDKLVDSPSPEKKFVANYQPRNEQTYEICRNCGDIKPKGSNQCTCQLYDREDMKKYTRYKLSSDNAL